ncbi:MAG: DUF6427 family protein [Saprospiraceae bacterium]|nr:DUF6427 family protein [Saprospiraceae bacterium]
MFIKFFRANLPFQQLFFLPFLGVLLWLNAFINPSNLIEYSFSMPLFNIFVNMFEGLVLLSTIVAFLILILQTFILHNAIRISGLTSKNSLFPALIYLTLMSMNSELLTLNPVLIANLFIIMALDLVFRIFAQEQPYAKILNAGIYISIASLFYLPAIFLGVFLWMSFIIYRQLEWRNFVIAILGLITPYVFLFFYLFWFDKLKEIPTEFLYFLSIENIFANHYSLFDIISISFLTILFLMSMKSLINNINKRVIKVRKLFSLTLWFLVISFASMMFSGELFVNHFLICVIPISIVLLNYFEIAKKLFWPELIFSLLLVSIFLERFF